MVKADKTYSKPPLIEFGEPYQFIISIIPDWRNPAEDGLFVICLN
jgi:hypothetical protein